MPRTLYRRGGPYLLSRVPLILYLVAWSVPVLGLIGAITYGSGSYEGAERFTHAGYVFGFVVLSVAVILTEIAALIERKSPVKLLLGLSAPLGLLPGVRYPDHGCFLTAAARSICSPASQ